ATAGADRPGVERAHRHSPTDDPGARRHLGRLPGGVAALGAAAVVAGARRGGRGVRGDPSPPGLQRLDPVPRSDDRGMGAPVAAPGARTGEPGRESGAAAAARHHWDDGCLAPPRPGARAAAGLAAAGGGAALPAEPGEYPAPAA